MNADTNGAVSLQMKLTRLTGFLAICYALWAGTIAPAQQYPFLPVAGSPRNVKVLFQDSSGRLWLGGDETVWFDGARFFSLRDYGFPAGESYSITDDPSGAIWIGTENGVYRFYGGSIQQITKGVAVSVIALTPDCAIAALGPVGRGIPVNATLVRMRRADNGWTSETITNLAAPGPLSRGPSGTIVYAWRPRGWREIRVETLLSWRPGKDLGWTDGGVLSGGQLGANWQGLKDHAGCGWIATVGGIVYNCGDGPHSLPVTQASIKPPMHEAPDGRMVLLGDNVLVVGRPGSFQVATRANGLPGLNDALSARDGTIWLGSTSGLYRFASPFRAESWTFRDGLPDPPYSITRVGNRIFAGLDRQIVALSQDRMRWDTVASFGAVGIISGLLSAGDGTLLAAPMYGPVVQLGKNDRIIAREASGVSGVGGMRLARTGDGEIWIGSKSLKRVTRAGNVIKTDEHQFPGGRHDFLAVKYEESTQELWSCSAGGAGLVVRDRQGMWAQFTARDRLRVSGCWSLAPLPNGDVWYAYYNVNAFGLIRRATNGSISVRNYDSPTQNYTFDLDENGRLWRSGATAIYIADPAEAEAGNWLQLDQSDGFPANDMNSGSVFVDTDGSLWWGADNDLEHYTPPADLVEPHFSPQIFLSAFSWANQPPKLAEAMNDLPHGTKITAHIGSLQFDRRNALRLRYRLLPEQTSWHETADLDLALGSLSSGSHTLEVQGRVFTGPWSAITRRSFQVLRPLWLAWPLVALYLFTAASASSAGFLAYRRRRADAAQVLPDLSGWRLPALLPDVHDVTGKVLDSRFEVGSLLARGGFASVLSGYDISQKQMCAVKIFRTEVKDKDWVLRSFDQEVAALKKVRHTNVVKIYAHGRAPSGAPYLVMEFVEGESLRKVLSLGALTPHRVARLLDQLAAALDAIHALDICHRDVKPENVIVRNAGSANEQAVLIDFSIAIVKDANETLHGLSRAAGTFDYMAPEQAMGYAQPSSDIFSLSKVVLELLTGQQLKSLLPDAALDLPDRVRELVTRLDLGLSNESIEMLATALEFDPSRRPLVAKEFAGPLVRDLQSDRANRTF